LAIDIQILETLEDLQAVEELQRVIWKGNDTEIVPVHLFRAAVHNGGLVIGAYEDAQLVGFVFGFVGIDTRGGFTRVIHASHMAGVHPDFRDSGLGYVLKRAQWQMVRHQGIDLITWTYDPLQSRNANLNIAKLGAVCNTYFPNYYGEMRDSINIGMPSDRFQVDLWVSSNRVNVKMKGNETKKVNPSDYFAARIPIINSTEPVGSGLLRPVESDFEIPDTELMLLEIPSNIQEIKTADPDLGILWSYQVRSMFVALFNHGYFVTDFIYLPGSPPRSYYVLSDGNAEL